MRDVGAQTRSVPADPGGGGGPRRQVELCEDVAQVPLDRPLLSESSAAMAALVLPAETSRSTCSSRRVSPCRAARPRVAASASSRARSGAAPRSLEDRRAAANSSSAPRHRRALRHARPIRLRTRAISYGAPTPCQTSRERRRAGSAASAAPAGEQDRAAGLGGDRLGHATSDRPRRPARIRCRPGPRPRCRRPRA